MQQSKTLHEKRVPELCKEAGKSGDNRTAVALTQTSGNWKLGRLAFRVSFLPDWVKSQAQLLATFAPGLWGDARLEESRCRLAR